jgi:uncharacterized protein YggE
MKTQRRISGIVIAAVLLVAILGASPAAAGTSPAADPPNPRLITVTGDAEVKVVPDEVILTLGVETWDQDLADAKRRNDEIVGRVMALAKAQGVDAKYIQTDYINIEPRYEYDYEKRNFIGYFVRKTIVITLKDLAAFEELLSSALVAGVTNVHGIEFRTTELRKYRDEARALAIQAAREKAEALAGELGQEVGEPYSIQEDPGWWWSAYSSYWGSSWGSSMTQNVTQNAGGTAAPAESTLAPGQISVNARVTVSFDLE